MQGDAGAPLNGEVWGSCWEWLRGLGSVGQLLFAADLLSFLNGHQRKQPDMSGSRV